MTAEIDPPAYTLVFNPATNSTPNTVAEFQKALEKGSDETKIEAMKEILVTMLEGNPLPEMLMHIIDVILQVLESVISIQF